jgi:exonuclease III
MLAGACDGQPHVVVLTDHKYAKTQDSLKRLLNGYQVHLHPLPTSATGCSKEPRYGVVVAVLQPLCEIGTVQNIPLHNNTLGQYVTHVLIELPESTPLHVLGVYCPPNGEAKKVRDSIYQECTTVIAQAKENRHTVILAGDWNGTVQDNDRASGKAYARDKQLRHFLQGSLLQHTEPPPANGTARPYTYLKGSAAKECSRIDDIYIYTAAQCQDKNLRKHSAQQ